MRAWICPTITEDKGVAVITEPADLAGRVVVGRIDAEVCGGPSPEPHTSCGLVRGHSGDHWLCSDELIEQGGAFALIRSLLGETEQEAAA